MPTCALRIDVLTLVPAVETEVAHEQALAPLSHGVGDPGGKPAKLSHTVDSERIL